MMVLGREIKQRRINLLKNFLKKSSVIALMIVILISICLIVENYNYNIEDYSYATTKTIEVQNVLKKSEETKINYSNTIHVLVTPEQKEKVQQQVKKMDNEIKMLAKVIYREARGESKQYQSAVAWCVLNRVDSPRYGSTIKKVITSPNQFAWYPDTPVTKKQKRISKDVITRWLLEKEGCSNVGRVLPNDYLFFAGRNGLNYFRKNYHSKEYWDWSLQSPYENDNL